MSRKLLICALLFVCACSPTSTKFSRVDVASRAQSEMVGMSKANVLGCMGPPARQATEGSVTVWSYASGGDSDAVIYTNPDVPISTGTLHHRYCVVNVTFSSDRVSRVSYSGRTGGLVTQGEQCAFAVANCVSQN